MNEFVLLLTILEHFGHSFLIPNEISEKEESFVKNQIEYIFIEAGVGWDEAAIICESYDDGTLAIVDDSDIRDFLGLALTETSLSAEDYWVGATAIEGYDTFRWNVKQTIYKGDNDYIRRGTENLKVNRSCLALSRQYHDALHFISLECKLNRAIICEKPAEKILTGSITTPEWIVTDHNEFGIFYDKKTWRESMRDCRNKHNADLATFANSDEIRTIGKFLLIGRPSLERAWIGAKYIRDGWYFVSDNSQISPTTNSETYFPPWRFNRTLKESGCLLIDRHLNKTPVFIETRCTQRRSYVCSRKTRYIPDTNNFVIKEELYTIFYLKKPWEDAFDTCKKINASLVKVNNLNLHDMMYIMGERAKEVRHIWIGGRLNSMGTAFYWVDDNLPIPKLNLDLDRYPPWYHNDFDANYACLNLDRENHNRPMFYGVACDYPQEFICMQKHVP